MDKLTLACLVVAAVVLAANQALKDGRRLAAKLPRVLTSRYWNYVPLAFLILAGLRWATSGGNHVDKQPVAAVPAVLIPNPQPSPSAPLVHRVVSHKKLQQPTVSTSSKEIPPTPTENHVESHNQSGGITAGSIGSVYVQGQQGMVLRPYDKEMLDKFVAETSTRPIRIYVMMGGDTEAAGLIREYLSSKNVPYSDITNEIRFYGGDMSGVMLDTTTAQIVVGPRRYK